ncbi:PIN domain-containing protein [Candidatus Gottesmanbacteria bacterium]|nr:PIN domain-containing protein [Candidatus Gottesmanbacteria bacterium]
MTHKRFLFVDSSAWISSVITTDTNHQKAAAIFSSFDIKTRLYISFFIISETITKIRKLLGQSKAYDLYNQFSDLEKGKSLSILPVDRNAIEKAILIMNKYPTPNTFSLTDATNIILMQQYKIPTLFSFDKDFKKLKIPSLCILP